jgi:hypothetical protein
MAANEDIKDQAITDGLVGTMFEMISPKKKTKMHHLRVINSPQTAEALVAANPTAATLVRKPSAKKTAHSTILLNFEADEDVNEEDSDVWSDKSDMSADESEFELRKECTHCKHMCVSSTVKDACTYCHDMYLCYPCLNNPNILGEHMKLHMTETRRPVRRAAVRAKNRL